MDMKETKRICKDRKAWRTVVEGMGILNYLYLFFFSQFNFFDLLCLTSFLCIMLLTVERYSQKGNEQMCIPCALPSY